MKLGQKSTKLLLLTWLLALCLSLSAAAADTLVPVGRCVGITLDTPGVTVVGFAENSAAEQAGLRHGDCLLSINNCEIETASEIKALLQPGGQAVLRVLRNGKENSFTVQVPPDAILGMLVRSGVSGIGTVTFCDPETGLFGALGHGVNDSSETLQRGTIVPAAVVEVVPGKPGHPGTLRGAYEPSPLGTIERNTPAGIFGHGSLPADVPALLLGEAVLGAATILTNVSGETVGKYTVEILDIDPDAATRNLLLQVTDPALLSLTGGVVQGMSGSPIIQDGKLVGAVTHVLVNDPTRGYGIFIENMLNAAS